MSLSVISQRDPAGAFPVLIAVKSQKSPFQRTEWAFCLIEIGLEMEHLEAEHKAKAVTIDFISILRFPTVY